MPHLEKLKMIKKDKELTNSEIATLSNLPLATITRVFNGQTPNPTFETISHIAIAMGVSLDELVGLKQPDEPPIPPPIENTLNTYSELLKEKDERIKDLKKEKDSEHKGRIRMTCAFVILALLISAVFVYDIMNGHIGHVRY